MGAICDAELHECQETVYLRRTQSLIRLARSSRPIVHVADHATTLDPVPFHVRPGISRRPATLAPHELVRVGLAGVDRIALVMRFARARGTGLSVHVAERRFRRIGVWDARIAPRVVAISPLGSPHDMAKIGTAWPTQYDHATGIAATVGGYNGFDSDGLVRLR
jgi:hypothetical protein